MKNQSYLYVKAFSDLGTFMDTIVLNVLVYNATHSTFWLSASMAAGTLGGVLSSVFSGVLADRTDRRKIMVVSDVLRAVMILSLIFFPFPAFILLTRFLNGILGSSFAVSFSASVPQLFGEGRVLEINSMIARLGSLSMIAGFFGAGVITDLIGYQTVLVVDGLSFLVSAWVLLRLRWNSVSAPSAQTATADKQPGPLRKILADLHEVKGYLALQPLLLLAFVLCLIDTFGSSPHNLGIPLLAEKISTDSQSFYYGLIWGVWGVGNVLATLALPKLRFVREHMFMTFLISTILMSSGFIMFLSNTALWLVLPFAFLTGIFDAGSVTLFATIMQKSDNHVRGRVFGISTLANRLGFGTGFVVAPFLLERLGLAHMVWTLHGLIITTTLIAVFVYLRIVATNASAKNIMTRHSA